MLTAAEENYLKSIYKIHQETNEPVSTMALANVMNQRPATITEAFRKLADLDLVRYEKYYGVELTLAGKRHALQILRRHRLWEQFLVQVLGFKWDEVHDLAEELEHIQNDKLIERLDAHLGFPKSDPHGDPIPTAEGELLVPESMKLSQAKAGDELTLVGVTRHVPEYLQFLESNGFKLGGRIKVNQVLPFDRSMLLKISDDNSTYLSSDAADWLLVVKG